MGRVAVVRQLYFPRDPKSRREVEALLEAGHDVDVICLRRGGEPIRDKFGRANVWRIPLSHRRGRLAIYLVEYTLVLFAVTVLLGLLHLRRAFDVIQVNTPPDHLVFSAIIPKLLGARVLLQLQEPTPEFFSTKFRSGSRSTAVRIVAWTEQLSIRFADFVITCTDQMRDTFVGRGASRAKIAVIVPTSNENEFSSRSSRSERSREERFVLVSHGSIEERYGLDTVIRAVKILKDEIPSLRFDIYGEGTYSGALHDLARQLDVEDVVSFHGWVPLEELVQAIADADAGVVAMKRDPFRDLTQCLKMYDFISMRRPAIVSRTLSVDQYFGDDALQKFTASDEVDLARAIRELRSDPSRADRLVERASQTTEPYRWVHQRQFYLGVVDSLVAADDRANLQLPLVGEPARSGS